MRIIIISDIQVGHRAAPWPEAFVTDEGVIYSASREQKILLEYIDDFFNQPEARDAEYVINLAESIEGANDKNFGRNLVTPDINLQIDAFEQIFKPYIRNRTYYSVAGSLYHGAEKLAVEDLVARRFPRGEYLGSVANLEFRGRIINIAHDPGDAVVYMATMLDKQSLFADAVEGPWPHSKFNFHIDLIARAHKHQFCLVQNESRIVLMNPAFKFWHPIEKYGMKNYFKSQPTIGGSVIEVGAKTLTVKPYFYKHQRIYDAIRNQGAKERRRGKGNGNTAAKN